MVSQAEKNDAETTYPIRSFGYIGTKAQMMDTQTQVERDVNISPTKGQAPRHRTLDLREPKSRPLRCDHLARILICVFRKGGAEMGIEVIGDDFLLSAKSNALQGREHAPEASYLVRRLRHAVESQKISSNGFKCEGCACENDMLEAGTEIPGKFSDKIRRKFGCLDVGVPIRDTEWLVSAQMDQEFSVNVSRSEQQCWHFMTCDCLGQADRPFEMQFLRTSVSNFPWGPIVMELDINRVRISCVDGLAKLEGKLEEWNGGHGDSLCG